MELGKDMRFVYKDLVKRWQVWLGKLQAWKAGIGQRGLQAMQNFDLLGAEGLFFFCTLLRVLRQGISSFVSLVLTIVDLEVVPREFLGLADLSGAQTLCLYEPTEVVVVGEYKHLMLRPF